MKNPPRLVVPGGQMETRYRIPRQGSRSAARLSSGVPSHQIVPCYVTWKAVSAAAGTVFRLVSQCGLTPCEN